MATRSNRAGGITEEMGQTRRLRFGSWGYCWNLLFSVALYERQPVGLWTVWEARIPPAVGFTSEDGDQRSDRAFAASSFAWWLSGCEWPIKDILLVATSPRSPIIGTLFATIARLCDNQHVLEHASGPMQLYLVGEARQSGLCYQTLWYQFHLI